MPLTAKKIAQHREKISTDASAPSARFSISGLGNISSVWWFRPYKPYIFWNHLIQGYQNWYYQVSHTQIHKYKYTNTQIQIHKYTPVTHITPNMLYIFEKRSVQGYQKWYLHTPPKKIFDQKIFLTKNFFYQKIFFDQKMFLTNKFFSTKNQACGIFLKRGLFMDIFWVSHGCTRSSCNVSQMSGR